MSSCSLLWDIEEKITGTLVFSLAVDTETRAGTLHFFLALISVDES
jgi:hypothetical protein